MTQTLQTQTGLATKDLCQRLGLPSSTLRRWRHRQCQGKPLLQTPGPKKLAPLPVAELQSKIQALDHGPHRSRATGVLYEEYAGSISRRELSTLIADARQECNRHQRLRWCQVDWTVPNLAWAIDATEAKDEHSKLILIATRELASRFFLEPKLSFQAPDGFLVAEHLRRLFQTHTPPLILKRDNGSIFDAQPVNQVLAEFGVIPLNSPSYYPPYNGSIENGIRELKTAMLQALPQPWPDSLEFINQTAEAVAQHRNCRPRRVLHGCSAMQEFYTAPARFTRRERHQIFHSLDLRFSEIINRMENVNRSTARAVWREVVVSWLRCQGLIDVTLNPKLLPYFPPICAQN
jgi:transposase-like protein